MKNIINAVLYLIAGLVIFLNLGLSQSDVDAYRLSYSGLGFGTRSLGLGTAYSAISNDFSAVYWNPAGLGQIRSNEVSFGLSHLSFDNTSTLFGEKESFSNSGTKLNSFGLIYPFPVTRGNLVFAIGYGRQSEFTGAIAIKGFNFQTNNIEYPDNIDVQGNILKNGGLNNWIVAGAMEAVKNLFVGLSLNFISGSYTYNRDYSELDIKNKYPIEEYVQKYTIDEDIGGFTAKAGMLYEFRNHNGRVGINIKFPSYLSVKHNYTNDEMEFYDSGAESLYQNTGIPEFNLTSPFVFSAGISYAFGDLLLSGDVDFTDWTQMEFSDPTDPDMLNDNTLIKERFKSTVNVRLGTEYAVPNTDLRLRAGFAYLPSPYIIDSSPNAQKFITGGLGWIIEDAVRIDLGYAYGFWNTDDGISHAITNYHNTTSNVIDVFVPIEEKVHTNTIMGTVSYRF